MQRKRQEQEPLYEVQPPEKQWVFMIRHSNRTFSPPTDVIELADKILVIVEIAGMRAADLNITLLEHLLVISGQRERPQHPSPAYHQVEIGYGEFRIEVALPWHVNREAVTASYEAGFLQVELPRTSPRQIRVVEVNDGEQ